MSDNADPTNATPDSTPPPSPVTPQDATPEAGSTPQPEFTQAQVDRMIGERAKRAGTSAINGLLETLGLESVDGLKSLIESDRKRKEAEMSETQKLQASLDAMTAQVEAANTRTATLEKARLDDKRDGNLLQLLTKAHDANNVLTLLKAQKPDDVNALIAEDGTFDTAKAEKLVADYSAGNAYLFSSGAPGSPSNKNGRMPAPDMKQEQKQMDNKFGKM